MAKRSAKQVASSIDQLRWVYWQTVRRTDKYRKDVAALLSDWRKACSPEAHRRVWPGKRRLRRIPREERIRRRGRFLATEYAVKAYSQLEEFSPADITPQASSSKHPKKPFVIEAELMSIIDKARRHRYYTISKPAKTLFDQLFSRKKKKEDGLPELESFSKRWGLGFPIPPSIDIPIEDIMYGQWPRPVKIEGKDRESLTLTLHPPAGREIVLAFVEGALVHFNPKRKRGGRMAWRTMSRKRGVKHEVQVKRLPGGRLKVAIGLPADKKDVRRIVSRHLPRSRANWREREYYEEVFEVVDLREKGRSRGEIAPGLKHGSPDVSQVRDRERAFKALVRTFGLP